MPLQNRVDPTGGIIMTPARGSFMGNRGGVLHNERREIVRPYASRRWITCVLEFKGRHREVMSSGRYTELFFLDEAVALAAGHRPCAECRRERFNAFREAWFRAYGGVRLPSADEVDRTLHTARIDRAKSKVKYTARLTSLPSGSFIEREDGSYLVTRGSLLLWTPHGYIRARSRAGFGDVTVLTPEPIVACLRHGYLPEIHQSARIF